MSGPDPLAQQLAAVVGAGHVLTDPGLTARYETDWTRRFSGRAHAVVRPADTGEVAGVVDVCAEAGAPIVTQGGNTGLVGGGVPRGGEVVLSTERLTVLGPVDRAGAALVAGAGVTLAALQRHAAEAGLAFCVDLAARDTATVGGLVATNAGGVHVLRYGAMRAQVLGVEAVLADSSVVANLGGLRKDNTGYDLAGLLTGSEGTLGIVTKACLALHPALPEQVAALLALRGLDEAVAVASHLRARLSSLEALEVMFDAGVEMTRGHANLPAPFADRHPCYLLVACAGINDPTDDLAAAVDSAPHVLDVAAAADRPARDRLWALRERHTEAVAALGVGHKLDVTLPVARLAAFVDALHEHLASTGATTFLWGHLGDGNLHVNIVGLPPDDMAVDEAVLQLVVEFGGSISAEHGIGVAKRDWLHLSRSQADRAAMRAIKTALDPKGLLNPGVLL